MKQDVKNLLKIQTPKKWGSIVELKNEKTRYFTPKETKILRKIMEIPIDELKKISARNISKRIKEDSSSIGKIMFIMSELGCKKAIAQRADLEKKREKNWLDNETGRRIHLSESEIKIARFMKEIPTEKLIKMNINNIANAMNVSHTTVSAVIRKLSKIGDKKIIDYWNLRKQVKTKSLQSDRSLLEYLKRTKNPDYYSLKYSKSEIEKEEVRKKYKN